MSPVSWLPVPPESPFPLQNLPFGVFSHAEEEPRVGVAIGEHVIDLAPLAAEELLDGTQAFTAPSLNPFLALGRPAWRAARSWLTALLTNPADRDVVEPHLVPLSQVRMHLPFEVADFVDFYSSRDHAENVGRILRPDEDALAPNWRHLPVAYHGRAGTVVVSGTQIRRPCGQRKAPTQSAPTYGPSRRLDVEAEVGFVVGTPSGLGAPVGADALREHVFGAVLVNDWSARDLQAWECVPLGPFLGKSFATSVSPWVVPLDALDAARVPAPVQDPEPLAYLRETESSALDLELEVRWNGTVVSRPPFRGMYWTAGQQLAHLSANGAALRTGDLFASGTVSGSERGQRGSFFELSWNGAEPVTLDDGSRRSFLEDGDEVSVTAWAPGAGGSRIGFGTVQGRIAEPVTGRTEPNEG